MQINTNIMIATTTNDPAATTYMSNEMQRNDSLVPLVF